MANPRGLPRSVEFLTWLVPSNINLLFGSAPAPTPFISGLSDNPIIKQYNTSIVSFQQSVNLSLVGKDSFYGIPGQPPTNMDFPNPKSKTSDIHSWIRLYSYTDPYRPILGSLIIVNNVSGQLETIGGYAVNSSYRVESLALDVKSTSTTLEFESLSRLNSNGILEILGTEKEVALEAIEIVSLNRKNSSMVEEVVLSNKNTNILTIENESIQRLSEPNYIEISSNAIFGRLYHIEFCSSGKMSFTIPSEIMSTNRIDRRNILEIGSSQRYEKIENIELLDSVGRNVFSPLEWQSLATLKVSTEDTKIPLEINGSSKGDAVCYLDISGLFASGISYYLEYKTSRIESFKIHAEIATSAYSKHILTEEIVYTPQGNSQLLTATRNSIFWACSLQTENLYSGTLFVTGENSKFQIEINTQENSSDLSFVDTWVYGPESTLSVSFLAPGRLLLVQEEIRILSV